jgi:hypothetical protein
MQQYPTQYHQATPVMYQRPANKDMKLAAIILFLVGFFLHIIGALTLFILIGIFFVIIGFLCYVAGFICLCFI